jgi:hypothetical protein
MSTRSDLLGVAGLARRTTWYAGGTILLVAGAILAGITAVTGSGVLLLPFSLPLLGAGYLVIRAVPGARFVGGMVAIIYGAIAAYAAAYPLHANLAPGPGQPDLRQIDVGSAVVSGAFFLAAAFILLGRGQTAPVDC